MSVFSPCVQMDNPSPTCERSRRSGRSINLNWYRRWRERETGATMLGKIKLRAWLAIGVLLVVGSGCGMSKSEQQAETAEAAAAHAQAAAARAEESASKALVAAQQATEAADKAVKAVDEATKALDRASERLDQLRQMREEEDAAANRHRPAHTRKASAAKTATASTAPAPPAAPASPAATSSPGSVN